MVDDEKEEKEKIDQTLMDHLERGYNSNDTKQE